MYDMSIMYDMSTVLYMSIMLYMANMYDMSTPFPYLTYASLQKLDLRVSTCESRAGIGPEEKALLIEEVKQ